MKIKKLKCPVCGRRLCDVIGGEGKVATSMVCPQCDKVVQVVLVAEKQKHETSVE